jgi:very-short-patch-repair endonuclease
VRRPTDRRRAREDGITDWHLRHREVERLSRDTYLPRAVSADLDQRVAAVLLGAPSTAVVSHLSAAALWGLEVPLVPEDARVHLTVPSATRVRHRADRRIHSSDVPPASVMRRRGFPLTSPGRTWLDLAAVVPPAALLAVADQMLARDYPRSWFDRYLDRAQGVRGVRAARRVAVLADRRSGSPMESVLRWLLEDAGLPAPVLQHTVLDRAGRFVGTVDLAWPRARLLVEFDGNVHRERDVFVKDLRRQNGLVLAGWTVLRFSSADVRGRPETVLAAIRSALASR